MPYKPRPFPLERASSPPRHRSLFYFPFRLAARAWLPSFPLFLLPPLCRLQEKGKSMKLAGQYLALRLFSRQDPKSPLRNCSPAAFLPFLLPRPMHSFPSCPLAAIPESLPCREKPPFSPFLPPFRPRESLLVSFLVGHIELALFFYLHCATLAKTAPRYMIASVVPFYPPPSPPHEKIVDLFFSRFEELKTEFLQAFFSFFLPY